MRWWKTGDHEWGLLVAPLHGRGEDANGSRILLYQMPPNPRDAWSTETISDTLHATHNFAIDGASVLVAAREGLVRFNRDPQTHTIISAPVRNTRSAGEVRLNQRFTATVEPMHGSTLAVYADDQRHELSSKLSEGHALAIGDLLKTGSDQIVVGWRGKGGGVRLFTPDDATLGNWRESVIDDSGMACEDVCLADLNADGKLDIIASGRATQNVKVYWNASGLGLAPATLPSK
jgi:hypothetical protein